MAQLRLLLHRCVLRPEDWWRPETTLGVSRLGADRFSMQRCGGRARPLSAAALKPGAVQSGRLARRAVEPLGEFDDQAVGSADVAEEEGVLEVDDLPDRFPAGLSDAADDATHVVDLEGDVPEPRTVRGRRQLFSAGGRRE